MCAQVLREKASGAPASAVWEEGHKGDLHAARAALAAATSRAEAAEAHVADAAERADAAEADAADLHAEALELRNAAAQLEAALRNSEARRCGVHAGNLNKLWLVEAFRLTVMLRKVACGSTHLTACDSGHATQCSQPHI